MQPSEHPERPLIRPHMPELDTARGIAILLVLLFHGLASPLSAPLSSWGRTLFAATRMGWAGVNLFFVLSGFLITGILLDTRNRSDYFRRFYFRRTLRILPALYATLITLWLTRLISWQFLALTAVFLANSANFFGLALQYGPLWSLAVEEQFYLLWPSVVRKLGTRTLAFILIVIWLATPVLRLAWAMTRHSPQALAVLNTWFNLDGLALGSLMAIWVRQDFFSRRWAWQLASAALVAGVVSDILLSEQGGSGEALLPCCCTLASAGLLIAMLLVGTNRWSFVVDRPELKFFGYISYGLYLIHVLAFHVAETLLVPATPYIIATWGASAAMLLRFVVGAGLGIGVAYVSRRSLEEKFLRMRFGVKPAPSAAKTAVAT